MKVEAGSSEVNLIHSKYETRTSMSQKQNHKSVVDREIDEANMQTCQSRWRVDGVHNGTPDLLLGRLLHTACCFTVPLTGSVERAVFMSPQHLKLSDGSAWAWLSSLF